MEEQNVGVWRISNTKAGNILVDAALGIGAENSGKLVAKVKQEAKKVATRKGIDLILVDGSPGIGCPVISSLSGADIALIVTEPTFSGLSDLTRVADLTKHFNIKTAVCINKFDINNDISVKIVQTCNEKGLLLAGRIPYDEDITKALVANQSIIEYKAKSKSKTAIEDIWQKILDNV